jgi:hypothetical protein
VSSVESEAVFVEIALEVPLGEGTLVSAEHDALYKTENLVDLRQVDGHFRAPILQPKLFVVSADPLRCGTRVVDEAHLRERRVGQVPVRHHPRACGHEFVDKASDLGGVPRLDDAKAGTAASLTFAFRNAHYELLADEWALATFLNATEKRFVHLHDWAKPSALL